MNVWMVKTYGAGGNSGWALFSEESIALEYAEKKAVKHGLDKLDRCAWIGHVWTGNGWITRMEVRKEPVYEISELGSL